MPSPAPPSKPPRPSQPPRRYRPARDGPGVAGRLALGLLVGLALAAAELRLGDAGPLHALELQTLDWRFRWRGPVPPGPETVLVMVDDRTAAELGAWPVPRAQIAEAIRRLADAGARVIALDLLFAEPAQGLTAGTRALLAELAAAAGAAALPEPLRARLDAALDGAADDPDRTLAEAIRAAGRVITPYAFVFATAEANRAEVPEQVRASAYRVRAERAGAPAEPAPAGLLTPVPALATAGVSTGHVTLLLERDGSLRAASPGIAYQGERYPSLPVEALRRYLGLPPDRLAWESGRLLRLGPLAVPLDGAGRQLVNHYGPPGTVPTFALADLVRGRLDPSLFAGRIVLIGAGAAGAGDRFATPFGARLPGAEFLAAAIDNMLHGRSLVRDDATRAIDLLAALGLALATACLAGRRSPLLSLAVVLAALAAWAALAQLAFARGGLWLAGVTPALAALAAGVAVETLRLVQERRRRGRLERQRANLGRYFPPSVVDRLAARDAPRALDRAQTATVAFVDLVGFTRTAEILGPAEAMALLRGFHALVERTVFAHRGMVDKFMGDGVMACFGVPDPAPEDAADALRMALDLLAALQRPLAAGAGPGRRLAVGIGIHRGEVLMGDVGGEAQLQFTVVGDAVNVASRLEALTRSAGSPLVASDAAVEAARPHLEPALLARLEPLPDAHLRGRAEPVPIWRLSGG